MTTFPPFPEFTILGPSFKETYIDFVSRFPPHADISFGNLIVWWSFDKEVEVSKLHKNLVIRYKNPFSDEKHLFYTLIGSHDVDDCLDEIFEYQLSQHEPPQLILTPDFVINSLQHPDKYTIIPDDDNADYILSTELLSELMGSNIAHIRRQVQRFLREAKNVEVKMLDLSSVKNKMMLTKITKDWKGAFPAHGNNPNHEIQALNKSLLLSDLVDCKCLTVYINGNLEGYSLYRHLPQSEYCIVNHVKESKQYPHLFDFIIHTMATKLRGQGIKYINLEQDLGIPGLRFHKEHLRPVTMLRKYTVSP